jgi:chromosome segregation ATPase
MRAEELEGIAKALEILTSDEARELFKSAIKEGVETGAKKVYNARSAENQIQHDTGVYEAGGIYGSGVALLQVGQDVATPKLAQAYKALKGSATRAHSVRLAMLAAQVTQAKVGHFDKVLAAIDTMMQTLKDEDAADIAKRDQCIDEYKNIDSTVGDVTWLIKNNAAKIDKLQGKIEKRAAELEQTIIDIATVKKQMEDMTAERTEENTAFKAAKKEDEDAVALLVEARAVLSSYYSNNTVEMGPIQGETKGLALTGLHQGPDFEVGEFDAPDAIFSDKGKRKNEAKGIVQLLTSVIEDLTDEISNEMKNEANSQLEYEKMYKAAEELKATLETKEVNLEDTIAIRKEEKSDEEELKSENEADLKDELDYKASIKTDCDWILKAFGERATKRQAEFEGLTKAKEFLAGLNKESLLETGHKPVAAAGFDDTNFAKIRFLGLRS